MRRDADEPRRAALAAFDQRRWRAAFTGLSELHRHGTLAADDLDRLAVAAYLVGEDDACERAWEEAHEALLAGDELDRATQIAVWLGIVLILRGDVARAGGWLGRAQRLVEEHDLSGPSPGYLLIPAALGALESGDPATSIELGRRAYEISRANDDADLAALAMISMGKAAIALGDVDDGTSFLDEAMLAVTEGRVSPIPAGIIYCAVIETCMALMDVRRAAEWTHALHRWCQEQPDLVPYHGQCLVHRSQVLQLHGEWREAAAEADRARVRLTDPPHPALGLACYQRAELHRLRGEHREAERTYREASRHGHEPTPGLALLRLAERRNDAATAAIRRALGETTSPWARSRLLAAAVEIYLGGGDLDAADAAADELAEVARGSSSPLLDALAEHATGSVLVARGDHAAALTALRAALAGWRTLEMPYEAARTRVQIGLACRALDDADAADLELDAARGELDRLAARTDLERLDTLLGEDPAATPPGGLTERECEVLRLVAAGHTNRRIGAELVISEHTVARHVQNIFTKLGVSSRSAATAYAYEHGIA